MWCDVWTRVNWCDGCVCLCHIPEIGVGRLECLYTVDDVGFEEEGSVLVSTDEFVDHFRYGMESDRMCSDLESQRTKGGRG